jgi:hypothetical protein
MPCHTCTSTDPRPLKKNAGGKWPYLRRVERGVRVTSSSSSQPSSLPTPSPPFEHYTTRELPWKDPMPSCSCHGTGRYPSLSSPDLLRLHEWTTNDRHASFAGRCEIGLAAPSKAGPCAGPSAGDVKTDELCRIRTSARMRQNHRHTARLCHAPGHSQKPVAL